MCTSRGTIMGNFGVIWDEKKKQRYNVFCVGIQRLNFLQNILFIYSLHIVYTLTRIQGLTTVRYVVQCVTNTVFSPKYEYECIWVNSFWQIRIQIYSGWNFLAKTNIFGSHFLDECEYIWVYQKWANMNTNILTDICKFKYKYKYYHTFFF